MTARLLGRLPRRHDKPTVHLADHLDAKAPAVAPREIPPPDGAHFGMYMNDELGCCTCSGVANLICSWDAAEQDTHIRPVDDDVLALYRLVTGGEDEGAMCLDVLEAWKLVGLGGDRVTAYVEVDPRRREHVRTAVWKLGGLYTGVTLPANAMDQVEAGEPWDIDRDDDGLEQPLGGHAVPLVGYSHSGPICVTWGKLQPMTWRWFGLCCEESFAVYDSSDWMGDVPGLDREGLIAALGRLSS